MSSLDANSVDPDQTPRSALGLPCLSLSFLWDARLKWVNFTAIYSTVFSESISR